MKKVHTLFAAGLLASVAGAAVLAQASTVYDPQQLPALQGKAAQYSLSPRGDVDGLILQDGTEVLLPPHLGAQLVFAVKPGDAVTVHGLKARAIPMVQAMSITNDATGATVTDNGPEGRGGPHGPGNAGDPVSVQGTVKAALHGPRGEVNGVLLTDGTIVRLPPPEARRLSADLAPGKPLYVQGNGLTSPLGKVVVAQAIGPDQGQLAPVAMPPRGHGPGPGHRHPEPPPPPSSGDQGGPAAR